MLLLFPTLALTQAPLPRPVHPLSGLDRYISDLQETWKVPGVAIGIVKNGRVFFSKGYGYADLDSRQGVSDQTLFGIGSCTKSFTAAAVCQLASTGKVDIDTPVANYVPGFTLQDPYITRQLTLRDMLSHRSGMARHDMVWYGADKSREELVRQLAHLPIDGAFRSTWQYQNLMYATAGWVIESLSQQSWEQYLRTHIFQPLEMKHTLSFSEEASPASLIALPYRHADGQFTLAPWRSARGIDPALSLFSNVEDMSRWLLFQLEAYRGASHQANVPSWLRECHRPHMVMPVEATPEESFQAYGLGWVISTYRGHLQVSHAGHIDGYSASMAFFPHDDLGIVILSNRDQTRFTDMLQRILADRMLELTLLDWHGTYWASQQPLHEQGNATSTLSLDIPPAPAPTASALPLPKTKTGRYHHPAYGTLRIFEKNGQPFFAYRFWESPLRPSQEGGFRVELKDWGSIPMHFLADERGDIWALQLSFQAEKKTVIFDLTDGEAQSALPPVPAK